MSGLRPIGHALICLLCLLSLFACGGGSVADAPAEFTFELIAETDPLRLIEGESIIRLTIPAPAGLALTPDALVIQWEGSTPVEIFEISASTTWPMVLTHVYTVAGSRSLVLEMRAGSTIIARAERLIDFRPNTPPALCGSITPTPVGNSIIGREPLTVQIDPDCDHDPDPFFESAVFFDVDYGDGEQLTAVSGEALAQKVKVYLTGTYRLGITGIDDDGQRSLLEFNVVAEFNAPPVMHLSTIPWVDNDILLLETLTEPARLYMNFYDSSDADDDLREVGTISIDWGDGSLPFVEEPFTTLDQVHHYYDQPGTYPLLVSLSAGQLTTSQALTVIKPDPIAPSACWTVDPSPVDGVIRGTTPFDLRIDPRCSTDPNSDLLTTGYFSTPAGTGAFADTVFPLTQRIFRAGQYPFTLKVGDEDGFWSEEISVMVNLAQGPTAPPVVCGTWDPPAVDGVVTGTVPFSPDLDLRCSSDFDSDLMQSGKLTVSFGDGPQLTDEPFGLYADSLKKPYTTAGTYTHTVIVTDWDGVASEPLITTIVVLP